MHSEDFLEEEIQIDEFVARDQIRRIDGWRAVLNDLFGQLILNVLMPRETIGAIGQCCGRRFEARDQGDEDITEQFRRKQIALESIESPRWLDETETQWNDLTWLE